MFVATTGPPSARVFLVGEAPGEWEDRSGKPFSPSSPAGKTLDLMLRQAGTSRHEVLLSNVARERPPNNQVAFFFEDKNCTKPKPIMQKWIDLLRDEIIRYNPNIIIGLGGVALWALTGIKGISQARGYIHECSLVQGKKVLCTYHPQKVNYEWQLLFTTVMDIRKALREAENPDPPKDYRALHAGVTRPEFLSYLAHLRHDHTEPVAVDIEVANPGVHPNVIGVAGSASEAYTLEIVNGLNPCFSVEGELETWIAIARLFRDKKVIMQNGMFDMSVLWHQLGIFPEKFVYDTMIAGHVLWPEQPRSLAYLSSICLNVPMWKDTSQSLPLLYNCADAANTYGVWDSLSAELTRLNLWGTFQFEMQQVYPATFLHLQGVQIDINKREEMRSELKQKLIDLDKKLEEAVGKKINFNSSKQLQNLLYIDMRLPVQYKRRKSRFEAKKATSDKEALKSLAVATGNPILLDIIAYKQTIKLLTSFVDMEVSPAGRVHTNYNITGATMARVKGKDMVVADDEDAYKSFGRWSSSKSIVLPYGSGNLQNIPREARILYTVPPGYTLLQADYMQAEAVVVAYLINDEPAKLLFAKAFGLNKKEREKQQLDIHKLTAALMYGCKVQAVTKEQRADGKVIRHGCNYAAGPKVVANKLGCSMTEAKQKLEAFHCACPQLHLWHMQIQDQLRQTRMLTNLLGRTHKFMGRWDDSLFRSAYAFIPQSTVGDLLNKSLCTVYGELNIYLQLHDAIYCLVPSDKIVESQKQMRELMLHPLKHNDEEFTIDVDFKLGQNWKEMIDFDDWLANGGNYEPKTS